VLGAERETNNGVVMTDQDAAQWYIARDGKQTGPMTDLEIKAIAAHRYFKPTDLVWRTGLAEWQPALSVFPTPVPATPPQLPPVMPQAAPEPMREQTARTADAREHAPAPQALRSEPAPRAPSSNASAPIQSTPFYPAPQKPSPIYPSQTSSPAASGFQAARPATATQPDFAERSAPRGPQPQAPSEQARLPVSPPYRDQTGRPTQPAHRFEQTSQAPQRLEHPAPKFDPPAQRPDQPRQDQPRFDQPRPDQPRDSIPYDAAARGSARADTLPTPQATHRSLAHDAPDAASIQPPKKKSRAVAWAIAATVLIASGGIWSVANPGLLKGVIAGLPAANEVVASSNTAVSTATIAAEKPSASEPVAAGATDLDQRWQKTAHWQVIKREFPDWYGERLRETAKLTSENKPETEIARALVDQMIALRRQNASLALSASTPKLKALANAFLNNLRQLKEQSTTACFNFISQGEATPGLLNQFSSSPGASSAMQLQVAAIFDAIADGRKTPVVHDKPQKTDYDALMGQLAKLGWSQTDVATFADPKALARAEPARVCQMVQDWFVAHVSIVDEATQERLLGETLRPVVSG
jgi:hypothetical protein